MDNIKDLIIANLNGHLDNNSYEIDFVLGKNIITIDSKMKLETFNGQTIVITDIVPGMPVVFEGVLIPLSAGLLVNYSIMLEFFVAEELLDDVIQAMTEITHEHLNIESYLLTGNTYLSYLASEPVIIETEIFNYRKFAKVSLPIVATISDKIRRSSDIELSIKIKDSQDQAELLPFLSAAVNMQGEVYSAQVFGTDFSTSVISDRSWAASVVTYAIEGTQNEALYNMLKTGSLQNQVFELTIQRSLTDIETVDVIVGTIEEMLDPKNFSTYSVGFIYAADVII